MYGRKVAVTWICALVVISTITLTGGVGIGISAGATDAEFQVLDADLEETTIVEGDDATITATVENVGNESGTFTAELETDANGVVDSTDVTIGAGETANVEFTRTFDTAESYQLGVSGEPAGTLTVTEPAAAEFTVRDVTLSDTDIEVGDSVDVTATVENTGDADGTYTADLVVDDETRDTRTVDVAAGDTETVSFTASFESADTYTVGVGDGPTQELTVTELDPATLSVTGATLEETTVVEGDSITVTADIENTGDREGSLSVAIEADGTVRTTDEVTVGANDDQTEEFTFTTADAGEYDITANDVAAGTLTVTEPASAEFTVTDVTLSNTEIEVGNSVDVSADVENTGDADGTYTTALIVDGADRDSKNVDVAAGDTEAVSFTTTFETAGDYRVSVGDAPTQELEVNPEPADISVTDASLSETDIDPGDAVTVTATAVNEGGSSGDITADLRVDGTTSESETRTLDPDAQTTIEFTPTFDESGMYDIAVNDETAGTLTVEAPADPTVTDATLEENTIVEGERVAVAATVENAGDREGSLSVAVAADRTVEATDEVTVGANDDETEEFTFTATDAGEYDITANEVSAGTLTVTEPATAEFTVTDVALSDDEIEVGESIDVAAAIENTGDADGTYAGDLVVDGEVRDSKTVEVAAGDTETVTFTTTFETAGEYRVTVDDASPQDLEVDLEPADISITDASLSETDIDPGDAVTVTATAVNDGGSSGEVTADLRVDGATRDTKSRTLDPGAEATIEFTPTFDEAGTYDIAVNDETAGTLDVAEPAAFEVSDAKLEDDTILAGDTAVVSAEVTNVGDNEGTFTAEASATDQDGTGVRIDSRSVTLAGGRSETIELRGAVEQAGEYDVAVERAAAGTLTVDEPADPTVSDATLEETTVVEDGRVTVTATVENTGGREGSLSVAVEADGDERATTEVTLGPGESTEERLTYTAADPGEYDITVNDVSAGTLTVTEPASAEFAVTDVTLSDDEVQVGDSVDVTAEIENTGDADGTYTAELEADDEVRDTTRVEVAAGDTETVSFTTTFETAGDYRVSVGDASSRDLEVDLEPADISITDASLSETDIDPGDAVTVTATAVNDGGSSGEVTADLRVDGTTRATNSRTLDPGAEATIEFTQTFDESGTYDIAVNGESAGTLDVAEPAAFEVSNAQLEDDTILAGDTAVVSAEVTNVGDNEGTYRFEARATGPDGTTETLDTDSVTLEGGESQTVELRGAVDRPGEYEVQVDQEAAGALTVESPAQLTVTGASLEEDVVSVDDEVTVTATVENVGDREGSLSVAVAADEEERAATEVSLGPGESTTEELTYTAAASGGYEVTVNGESAGTLDVTEPATFRTTNANVERATVIEGESIEVTGTVVNVGSESGVHTATLSIDGETVESKDRTIGPDDSESISFSRTFETATEVEIAVNDEPAGTLSVLEPADVSIRETALTPETITAGESAMVTVELANDGDVEGELTTRLGDGSETLDTVTRSVGPNGIETVRFERSFQSAGEYELEVNDESVGTLAVLEPADVSFGSSSLASKTVERNESIELTVELRNDGEATGEQGVNITLGDGTGIQRTTPVPDNGTTVTVSHAYTATGKYPVAVDGDTVGTVNVVEPRENTRSGGGGGGGPSESSESSESTDPSESSESSESTDPSEPSESSESSDPSESTDPSGSSGDSGSSGTDGSSGATGGSGGAPTMDPEPTVARSVSEEAVAVDISGAEGERFESAVELAGPSASEPAVSLSSFAVNPAGEHDAFEATIGRPTAEPNGLDPVPYGVALGYVSFDSTLDESETSAVTLRLAVNEASLPAGLGPEDVAVMRYTDDGWTTANVTLEGSVDSRTVTLPRASPVAVVALEPGSVDIVETVGPADRVRAGYETTLRVRVDNPGDRPANRTLTLGVNGEPVAEREVTLGPDQNATVPIAFEPPESGTVSLNGDDIGEVTLFEGANGSASTNGDDTDEDTPGFGVVAALVALVITTVVARRRP